MQKADYSKLIDAQTWGFIRKAESWYPPDTINLSVASQRDVYDRMCRAFRCDYPKGVHAQDKMADGVPVRCYDKADNAATAVALYFHGGGFVVGGLESHDDVCAEICHRTGFSVISVDYRMAPEHLHPAAYDDCLVAFQWATREYKLPLVLVGDSAGGNLAAAVAHSARKLDNRVAGMVLIYPTLAENKDCGSYAVHANAPMLNRADINFYADIRTQGADVSGDVTYAPLSDSDFSGLPPTVVFSAECDPLCDDGEDYCAALHNAGGQGVWVNELGLVHGYLRARHSADRARDSFSRIVFAIDMFGQGQQVTRDDLESLAPFTT
ncbi:MAG: alpha/beta hydrolase [Amylibacter sp.]